MSINTDLLAKAREALAAKKLGLATPAEGGYKTNPSNLANQAANQQAIASPASLDPVAKAKALLAAKLASKQVQASQPVQPAQPASGIYILDRYGNQIQLNAKQAEFATLASQRQSAVLIGAAGTGKTTSMKAAIKLLIDSGIGLLESNGHKKLVTSGTPAIVGCAYTRIAVSNLRANMPADMKPNCLTIHALLEYQPVFEDYVDEHGNFRTKKYFLSLAGYTICSRHSIQQLLDAPKLIVRLASVHPEHAQAVEAIQLGSSNTALFIIPASKPDSKELKLNEYRT